MGKNFLQPVSLLPFSCVTVSASLDAGATAVVVGSATASVVDGETSAVSMVLVEDFDLAEASDVPEALVSGAAAAGSTVPVDAGEILSTGSVVLISVL